MLLQNPEIRINGFLHVLYGTAQGFVFRLFNSIYAFGFSVVA